MIRFNKSLNIALSPLNLSPNNYANKTQAPVAEAIAKEVSKDKEDHRFDKPIASSTGQPTLSGTKGKVTAGTGEEEEEDRKNHFE